MSRKFVEKIKKRLEKEKISIEKELLRFAKKDTRPSGDWDTKFPKLEGEISSEALEDKPKRIEEYEKMLPVEFALEKKLKNINLALEKIEKGKYGICEKCGKEISKTRLLVVPEARFCRKCQE